MTLFGPVVDAVRRRRWHALWLGPATALLVGVLAMAFRTRPGHAFLEDYAITFPGDAVGATLVKLPLSMFAPAALLPFWFALVQVFVVYSLAQSLIGARLTIVVAVTGHALATLADRLWILAERPFGVGHGYLHFGDAGPSVAVVTLLAYTAVVRRVDWLAAAIVAYDTVEISIFNGLSQREHLIGTATGVLAGTLSRRLVGRGRLRAGAAPGLPADDGHLVDTAPGPR